MKFPKSKLYSCKHRNFAVLSYSIISSEHCQLFGIFHMHQNRWGDRIFLNTITKQKEHHKAKKEQQGLLSQVAQ